MRWHLGLVYVITLVLSFWLGLLHGRMTALEEENRAIMVAVDALIEADLERWAKENGVPFESVKPKKDLTLLNQFRGAE